LAAAPGATCRDVARDLDRPAAFISSANTGSPRQRRRRATRGGRPCPRHTGKEARTVRWKRGPLVKILRAIRRTHPQQAQGQRGY
jgi:hypothetical protein